MKPKDTEELMSEAEEIAQILNQGNLEIAKKRTAELTTKDATPSHTTAQKLANHHQNPAFLLEGFYTGVSLFLDPYRWSSKIYSKTK